MRKINALIKYEILNLKRGALIWVMLILYAFGVQQVISNMVPKFGSFLSLVELIKTSWLPLNFIMIPVMLMCMKIGGSEDPVIKAIDISPKDLILGKLGAVFIIDGIILTANIMLAIIIGIICKVSFGYFIYETIGYVINTVVFLLVTSSIGLLLGQTVSKYAGDVISFIAVIIIFIVLCNFYKEFNTITPVFNIRIFASIFDVISYDRGYLYHNVFWLMVALAAGLMAFSHQFRREISGRRRSINLAIGVLLSVFCSYLAIGIIARTPKYYDIRPRREVVQDAGISNKEFTFFSRDNCGYQVEKYVMDISLDNNIKNSCEAEIAVTGEDISSIELGLYEKLNIDTVKVDGSTAAFKRTKNSFIVNLPRKFHKDEKFKVMVSYEGKINTMWLQGQPQFYVRNNSMFLADVFEWYPKLNDNSLKEYTVNLSYNSKNKMYSNLDIESKSNKTNEYTLKGKDREIFLVSGNVIERQYKGHTFVGNEEYINKDSHCEQILTLMKQKNSEHLNKVIVGPYIAGGGEMEQGYEKAYLFGTN